MRKSAKIFGVIKGKSIGSIYNAYIELFLSKTFYNNSLVSNELSGSGKVLGKISKKKGPSIKALLQHIPHQEIQCGDSKALFNTNTPEQWQQAKKQFGF